MYQMKKRTYDETSDDNDKRDGSWDSKDEIIVAQTDNSVDSPSEIWDMENLIEKHRERNREHAKKTRLRKKALIDGMKLRLLELQNEVINIYERF